MQVRPLDLARRWHAEGFVTADGMEALEARYASDDGPGHLTTALLAGAAAVLAAALIAIPFLGSWDDVAVRIHFVATGSLAALAGALLWPVIRWKEAAEALSVTAAALLVPAGLMFLFDGPQTALVALLVAAVGAVAVTLPARTPLVATAGATALHVGVAAAAMDTWNDEGSWAWLALSLAMTGLAFATVRLEAWRAPHALLNVAAPIVLGVASLVWWMSVLEGTWTFAGSAELTVAAIQAPVLVLAFMRRARAILIGSVAVIAVDAIVFGFDIGSLALGIPMLLAVAGGLVALALWARRVDGDQA